MAYNKPVIKKLDWDSKFFGFNIGSCSGALLKGKGEEKFVKEFRRKKFDCVYIFCDEKNKICAKLDKKKYLLPVGGHAEYELTKNNWQRGKGWSKQDVRVFNQGEIKGSGLASDVKFLSRDLAPISRFYKDSRFNPYVRDMYEVWADKIIRGKNSLMIINIKDDRVAGLVGCQLDKDVGHIALVKTKKEFEGQGIASKLLDYAIEKLFARGAKKIIVVTQANNEAAKKLYERFGFKIKKITNIHHWWR